jgi:peroxiredoxin
LAEYRDLYSSFRAAGANVVAISVDAPQNSEALRQDLHLPFPLLSDPQRRVVRQWDICNARERGGIAKPAVFILSPDRIVRFASVDQVASRVPAAEILRRSSEPHSDPGAHRKKLIPGPKTFFRAISNNIKELRPGIGKSTAG